MWITWIIKYWRYALALVVMVVIGYCVHQYGKSHYERGKIDGIANIKAVTPSE